MYLYNAVKINMLVSHTPRAGLPGFADEALNVGANITFSESMKQHFVKQCNLGFSSFQKWHFSIWRDAFHSCSISYNFSTVMLIRAFVKKSSLPNFNRSNYQCGIILMLIAGQRQHCVMLILYAASNIMPKALQRYFYEGTVAIH